MSDSVERLYKLFPESNAGSDIAAMAADEIELLRTVRYAQGRTIQSPNADLIDVILSEAGVSDHAYLAVKIAETFDGNTLRSALEQIATGHISGEPNNYRDTLHICRGIAQEALRTATTDEA